MRSAMVSYGLGLAALLLIGPCAWLLTSAITDVAGATARADGWAGAGSSLLLTGSGVLLSVLKVYLAIGLACAMGIVSARAVSAKAGLWNAGVVLAWAAAGLGSIDAIVRAQGGAQGVLWRLAIEGLIVGAPTVLAAWAIWNARKDRADADTTSQVRSTALEAGGIFAAAAGAAIGAHLMMQSNMKGQAIGSAAGGAVLAAVAATLIWTRGPGWVIVAGTLSLAVIGPLLVHFTQSPGALTPGLLGAQVTGLGRITPLDWCAGALLGTPIGLWAATGLIERKAETVARVEGRS